MTVRYFLFVVCLFSQISVAGVLEQFKEQPDSSKASILADAITRNGQQCGGDSRIFFAGDAGAALDDPPSAFWDVACDGGEDFRVQVVDDEQGTTKVAPCAGLAAIGIACFKKLNATPQRSPQEKAWTQNVTAADCKRASKERSMLRDAGLENSTPYRKATAIFDHCMENNIR